MERLRQWAGQTPAEEAALLLAVGLVCGVFPIAFVPTLLCLLAASTLRLNWVVLQLLNNLCWPLQVALFVPLQRLGASFCRGTLPSAGAIGALAVRAVAGWMFVAIPAGVLIYFVLVIAIRLSRVRCVDAADVSV